MILAFALALVGIVLMGILFAVARNGKTFGQTVAAVLAGLALIILLPLYGSLLLVSIALSGLWRAGCAWAHAARRALHHFGSRHRTNP
jgi:hypothetical protein